MSVAGQRLLHRRRRDVLDRNVLALRREEYDAARVRHQNGCARVTVMRVQLFDDHDGRFVLIDQCFKIIKQLLKPVLDRPAGIEPEHARLDQLRFDRPIRQ